MSQFCRLLGISVAIFLWSTSTWAQISIDQQKTWKTACQLEEAQKFDEAFNLFLEVPGAEYKAAQIARQDPEKYLGTLDRQFPVQTNPRVWLVRGDAFLKMGKPDEALKCYRAFVAKIGTLKTHTWDKGLVPRDYYPPEYIPASETRSSKYKPILQQPFLQGTGSYHDNFLIRRFLALEAWTDATREYQRIWALHQKNVVPRDQFPAKSLEFILDYGYFLKRQNQIQAELRLLLYPVIQMNLERSPYLPMDGRESRPLYQEAIGEMTQEITRPQYLQLVLDEFLTQHQEALLLKALQTSISQGNTSARRTLSHLLAKLGRDEEALQVELEFIQSQPFNQFSTAYRRAASFVRANRIPEAIIEYEKCLLYLGQPMQLPEPGRWISDNEFLGPVRYYPPQPLDPKFIYATLEKLYASLDVPDRMLDLKLNQLDSSGDSLAPEEALTLANSFRQAGRFNEFIYWVKRNQSFYSHNPAVKAGLLLSIDDRDATIAALTEAFCRKSFVDYEFPKWLQLLQTHHPDWVEPLKAAIARQTELSALDLSTSPSQPTPTPPEVTSALKIDSEIERMESFLASGKNLPLNTQPEYDPNRFRSWFELGYRLMRLYQKAGKPNQMLTLAERIARRAPPFNETQKPATLIADLNGHYGKAALFIAASVITTIEQRNQICDLLDDTWPRVAYRVRNRSFLNRSDGYPLPSWANKPPDMAFLAAKEEALSMAVDATHLYVGYPWGVTIQSLEGQVQNQVALEDAALSLAVVQDDLWVGTPHGLKRLNLKTYQVSQIFISERLLSPFLTAKGTTTRRVFQPAVIELAYHNGLLWIGTPQTVWTCDPKTLKVRVFTPEELGSETEWYNFLPSGLGIWAQGRDRVVCYNPQLDRWETPSIAPSQAFRLIGIFDNVLWGTLKLDDQRGYRLCQVDQTHLTVTPVLVAGEPNQSGPNLPEMCVFGPIAGKYYFGSDKVEFRYDPATKRLIRLQPSEYNGILQTLGSTVTDESRLKLSYQKYYGGIVYRPVASTSVDLIQQQIAYLLPNQWLSILGQTVECPNVLEPALEWSHQFRGSATRPDPKVKLTGSRLYTAATHGKDLPFHGGRTIDTIQSNQVYSVLTDPANGTIWICTGFDIFRLNRFLQKTDTLRVCFRNDSEFITNGIKYGGSWYFVSPTYQFSSLMEYDPATAISTPFDVSDGLPEHPISSLVVDEQGLRIEFEPVLKNGVWFVADPTYFYPDTKIFRPISAPRPATEAELQAILRLNTPSVLPPMPYLGGQIIKKLVIGQRTFLCGTRGLVVFASDQPMPQLQVTRLIADKPLSQDQLQGKSQPLVAPGSASSKFTLEDLPELHAMLRAHSDKKAIITAAQACQALNDQTAIPFLIEALDFEDRETRSALCSALGTLKAIEAIPRIKELYLRTLASNPDSLYFDFVRGRNGWYSRQLTDITIEVDWLRLKSMLPKKEPVSSRPPAPPIDFYPLLTQLKPIGPEHLQDLYRLFAQSHNHLLSLEAIQNLANCLEIDKPRNFVLLKQLETNPDWEIQVTALAGLAACGEVSSQRKILDRFKNTTTQKHQRMFLLATLGKISDKSKLKFAVSALRHQLERSKDQQEISLIQALLTEF